MLAGLRRSLARHPAPAAREGWSRVPPHVRSPRKAMHPGRGPRTVSFDRGPLSQRGREAEVGHVRVELHAGTADQHRVPAIAVHGNDDVEQLPGVEPPLASAAHVLLETTSFSKSSSAARSSAVSSGSPPALSGPARMRATSASVSPA